MSALEAAVVADRTARWLERENGTGDLQHVMQILAKPLEELDEVLEELDEADPRPAKVALECADLFITVRTAQAALGIAPRRGPSLRDWPRLEVADATMGLVRAVTKLGPYVVGWQQQNPRKRAFGEYVSPDVVSNQLDVVALQACRLIVALGLDADEVLAIGAAKVHARLDQVGVPQ